MKPTTEQIDAYCAALKAFYRDEHVEMRRVYASELPDKWEPFRQHDIGEAWEYRIAPAPPKLREWLLSPRTLNAYPPDHVVVQSGSTDEFIHVREVSETADAEIAEKLRNHDALCRAWIALQGAVHPDYLATTLDKHGAKLP